MELNNNDEGFKVYGKGALETSHRLTYALELLGVEHSDPINFQIDLVTAIHKYAGAMQNDDLAKESEQLVNRLKARESRVIK